MLNAFRRGSRIKLPKANRFPVGGWPLEDGGGAGAIHLDGGAADVAGPVGGQEDDEGSDIGGLAQTICLAALPHGLGTCINIQGVMYAKDLMPYLREGRTDVPLKSILREAYFIPETKRAGDLLPDLQQRRVHMAIVVDEYGGVAGLVTIEDILEEIVGEIQDEYDTEEPFVEYISDEEGQWSAYILDARVDLGDLNQLLDAGLPTEESDTLGGFIYSELGRVPVVGDRIMYEDLDFTVESVAGRRIKKVRVERHLPVEQGSDAIEDAAASAAG